MRVGGYLLLRRTGALWGVANDCVTAVRRGSEGVVIETRTGSVVADEVLALAEGLEVHRPGGLLRRFAGASVAGLAVYQGLCVAIVDVDHPPDALQIGGSTGSVPEASTGRPDAPENEPLSGGPMAEGEGGNGKTGG